MNRYNMNKNQLQFTRKNFNKLHLKEIMNDESLDKLETDVAHSSPASALSEWVAMGRERPAVARSASYRRQLRRR